MMPIAVLVGEEGQVVRIEEMTGIKVFSKEEKEWHMVKEIPFKMKDISQIKEIRKSFNQVISLIEECKIVVGQKIDGIAYHVFEAAGFDLFEVDGEPLMFLDEIMKEIEEERYTREKQKERIKQEEDYLVKIKEGHYRVDLGLVQKKNGQLSSKQILLPILEQGGFETLEIKCEHMPPWIEQGICRYSLEMTNKELESGEYLLILTNMRKIIQ